MLLKLMERKIKIENCKQGVNVPLGCTPVTIIYSQQKNSQIIYFIKKN